MASEVRAPGLSPSARSRKSLSAKGVESVRTLGVAPGPANSLQWSCRPYTEQGAGAGVEHGADADGSDRVGNQQAAEHTEPHPVKLLVGWAADGLRIGQQGAKELPRLIERAPEAIAKIVAPCLLGGGLRRVVGGHRQDKEQHEYESETAHRTPPRRFAET